MYLDHFQLKDQPFRLSPDPAYLYLSQIHSRAKAYMESTIWFSDGFVVITGEIGSGKTTLIETFLKDVPDDVVVAQINQTQISPVEFLQSMLVQFGFHPFKMRKAELLATINEFLIEQYSRGRKVLLIIDEAQNLSSKVLEEVRLLSGVETTKQKVLHIILAGQPELNKKLDSPELTQLMQRVRLRFHLNALSEPDTTEYVRHRLRVAGAGDRDLFEPETFPVIFRYSGGIPRLVNVLCDTALLVAFAQDRESVSTEVLNDAIRELQWVEFGSRGSTQVRPRADDTTPQVQLPGGRLVVSLDGKVLLERPVRMGRCVIGRTPDNDIQIDSTYISRHHAQVVATTDGVLIEDLNSTNGMFVGGERVHSHRFADGDVVRMGLHEIRYHGAEHTSSATGELYRPSSEEEPGDEPDLASGEEPEDMEDSEDPEGSEEDAEVAAADSRRN
jgi:type II secretory pathway predicted ATPase ExeA